MTALEPVELVDRIWARDPTIWTGTDEAHWLGWLDEPARMLERVDELEALPRDFEDVVLLGMGGSSLAPEVIRRTFAISRFHVLDTTHPSAIRRLEEQVDLDRTLFIAASKSGTTLETRCQLDYFLARGGTFAAITDPGTELESLAKERDFAWVVNGEPTIGGRYSALSPFGMVPAALMDLEVGTLLERAEAMAQWCRLGDDNPGLEFGMQLGESWSEGRDKVCIDETPGGFGLWAEQLLAESTGKDGKGLVPAPGEDPVAGPDRQPGRVRLDDPYDLGAEFFRWEFATAVAGSILGINPFIQPDVQAAKDRTPPSSLRAMARGQSPGQVRRGRSRICSTGQNPRSTWQFSPSSIPSARGSSTHLSTGLARPVASSRKASARATCTRRVSCTKAARTLCSRSRSSTTWGRSSTSRAATSASGR